MLTITWSIAAGVAFLVSGVASYALSRYRGRWSVLDEPNSRSLHVTPVPRVGGIAIILGILVSWCMTYRGSGPGMLSVCAPVIVAFAVVITVSFLDDILSVPILVRLAGYVLAAGLVVFCGLSMHTFSIAAWSFRIPVLLEVALTILFIVWMTNLYNFMDGMDGFAAGMGIIGFGASAILGFIAGAQGFAQVNASIAAACAGFLLLNFPSARLFMGDVGAASLGFLAAVLMLYADQQGIYPLWIGILVFSPFVVDATWTLLRRMLAGRTPWQAHREHFYQRLVQLGWGHRRTVLNEYALMLFCSCSAVSLYLIKSTTTRLIGLGIIVLGYIILGLLVRNLEMRQRGKGR